MADRTSPHRTMELLRPVQLSLVAHSGTRTTSTGPVLGVYRISRREHRQTGVIADVVVDACTIDRLLGHEQTRTAREGALINELDEVELTAGPAVLAHRPHPGLSAVVNHLAAGVPSGTWRTDDDTRHEVWIIAGQQLASLLRACAVMERLYIIDGHHRIAAAARRAAAQQRQGDAPTGPWDSVLAAVFPTDELAVHAYHRVVDLPPGQRPAQLLDALAGCCEVVPVADLAAARPRAAGHFGMGLAGRWYWLTPRQRVLDGAPDGRTAVELLDELILGPVIGIADPRRDQRIHFVADVDERRLVEHGRHPDRACFLVSSLTIEEVIAVADADRMLPPKSTWFDPKPISGAVLAVQHHPADADEAATSG